MSNRRKLRRVAPQEDLSRCRWPGCGSRWTTEITRQDGYSAFVCDDHAVQLLEETPEEEIRSVRSTGF